MANPLSSLGAGTLDAKIKEKTVIGTHPEQKFGASLATWHCPATLKSPRTKILPFDKSPVKFGRWYFRCQNQRGNSHWNPSRAKIWSISTTWTTPATQNVIFLIHLLTHIIIYLPILLDLSMMCCTI